MLVCIIARYVVVEAKPSGRVQGFVNSVCRGIDGANALKLIKSAQPRRGDIIIAKIDRVDAEPRSG